MKKQILTVTGVVLFAAFGVFAPWFASDAQAAPCVVPDNGSGTVTLPPAGCDYLSPQDVHEITDGLPPGTTIELTGIHRDFACGSDGTPPAGCSFVPSPACQQQGGQFPGGEKECSDSQLALQLHGTGLLAGYDRPISIPVSFETHVAPRVPGSPVQSFNTDMFRLFGQIPPGDPDFDLLRISAGTAFGMPSPGHTRLTQLPGNTWAVDSFFDVFYRIDFVGRNPGPLAGRSGSTTATIRMSTGGCVPANCDDGNPCTTDACNQGVCSNIAVSCDDNQICTDDFCDPATGQCSHLPANCEDGNPCTIDSCIQALLAPQCLVPDNGSGTVTLPPVGCDYLSPTDVHQIIAGLPAGTTIQLGAIHKDFACGRSQPGAGVCSFPTIPGVDCEDTGGVLGGDKECSDSKLALTLQGTGTLAGWNRTIMLPISFETHTGPRTPGDPVQSFDTQMFRMFGQMVNIGDPDFDLLRIVAGHDFGLPSPGHTTLTRQFPGGPFAVDSFFDITYRIDFVGAPGGRVAGMLGSTTATIRMQTGSGVGCVHTPTDCDDNNACTQDSCDPVTGCVHLPISCNDNNACTTDSCNPTTGCVNTPTNCDDGQICTIDACDPATGQCTHTPTNCDDGNACTADSCIQGLVALAPACIVPDNGAGTVTLPPAGCDYLSPQDVHQIVAGLPLGTTIELGAIHKNFICHQPPKNEGVCTFAPPPGFCEQSGGTLGGRKECSDSQVEMNLHGTGVLAGFDRPIQIIATFETHVGPRTPGAPVQSFDTDMFRLQGQLPIGDPDFDLLRITAGTGFGMPSPGHTTLTRLPNGDWAVDSVFDISYRIDFIGKPGGRLSGMSGSTTGTIRMQTGSGVGCVHTPISCDDNNACTTDSCNPTTGCVNTPTSCDDGQICTDDACNPVTGQCTHTQTNCADGNACTDDSCAQALVLTPPCTVPDNGNGTVTLPPAGCEYLSPQDVHEIIDGLPAGTTIELGTIHKDFICNRGPAGGGVCSFQQLADCDEAGGSLGGEKECSDSTLGMSLHGTGLLAGFDRTFQLPISFETHVGPRTPGNPVQSFDTDMFRLFGQILGDPDFDLLRVVAGTDFGMPSPGHTTLTQLPGGNWAVDSFFDIKYRIDFVGAAGGPLAGRSGSTTGTIRMQTGSGVGCVHTPTDCDDNNACTTDSCNPTTGCVNTPTNCDDGQICTIDACDPATGQCTHTPTNCDDGNACTADSCIQAFAPLAPACVVPDNGGGTVSLPPAGCDYLSPQDVHEIVDGLPVGTTIELAPIHKNFICHQPPRQDGVCTFVPPPGFCEQPGGTLGGRQECSDSTLDMNLQGTGVLTGYSRTLQIPVTFETHVGPRTPGAPFQSFPTDMFRLKGQLPPGDPDFALLRIRAGTGFGLPSPGHTTLTQLPGGNWAVDSIFDIVYEIEFIGAPGGPFAGMSGVTQRVIRMQTGSGVGCVHTPIVCNDNNPCTNDSCDPTSGCVFTNNTAACNDNNPCTVADVCGGGACSGTPITAPAETQNVQAAANKTTYTWNPAVFAQQYDVVRGVVVALPVGPGGGDEVCFANLPNPTVNDAAVPPLGQAFFYLSRGENTCGSGTYGTRSNGAPRVTTTCP